MWRTGGSVDDRVQGWSSRNAGIKGARAWQAVAVVRDGRAHLSLPFRYVEFSAFEVHTRGLWRVRFSRFELFSWGFYVISVKSGNGRSTSFE